MKCLSNKWNRDVKKGLLFHFVAVWHFVFAQLFLSKNEVWRLRPNSETYSPSNPFTHQTVGDFEKPMAFSQSSRFENLNKVEVNVFR